MVTAGNNQRNDVVFVRCRWGSEIGGLGGREAAGAPRGATHAEKSEGRPGVSAVLRPPRQRPTVVI